jgi:ABC-type multidrug transport system ATPase subunit
MSYLPDVGSPLAGSVGSVGEAPLLTAAAARLDVAGVPVVDGLDLRTRGERVAILGGPRALFEAAAGLREVAHGEVRLLGMAPPEAVRSRGVAGAPFEPPLPTRWSVTEYVTWSARLAGHDRREARTRAGEAIEAMELGTLAGARIGGTTPTAKRGIVLAAAIATGAAVLLVEDPLAGLADEALAAFGRVVAKALQGRRYALFASRLPLESALAGTTDEVLVLGGSTVVAQGAPAAIAAERTAVALKVGGTPEDVAAYATAIESHGATTSVLGQGLGLTHLKVELGPLARKDLFRLALETRTALLELRPFSLPLS